jgi:hypothetical protein
MRQGTPEGMNAPGILCRLGDPISVAIDHPCSRFLTIAMPGNKLLRMLGALSGVAFQLGCLRNNSFSSFSRVF